MKEQLPNLIWIFPLRANNNYINAIWCIVHNQPMLYPVSCLLLFTIQHLPSLAGENFLWTTPNLTSKACDKRDQVNRFSYSVHLQLNKHAIM